MITRDIYVFNKENTTVSIIDVFLSCASLPILLLVCLCCSKADDDSETDGDTDTV
jgi:hypothetical protein